MQRYVGLILVLMLLACGDAPKSKPKSNANTAASGSCSMSGLDGGQMAGFYDQLVLGSGHEVRVQGQTSQGQKANLVLLNMPGQEGALEPGVQSTRKLDANSPCMGFCVAATMDLGNSDLSYFAPTAGEVVVTLPASTGRIELTLKDMTFSEVVQGEDGKGEVSPSGKTWCLPSYTGSVEVTRLSCDRPDERACSADGTKLLACQQDKTFGVAQDCAATRTVCGPGASGESVSCVAPPT